MEGHRRLSCSCNRRPKSFCFKSDAEHVHGQTEQLNLELPSDENDLEKHPSIVQMNTTSFGEVVDLNASGPDILDANVDGIQYKTMSWWHVGVLMVAETVSLGILSLPSAIARLGLVPGLLLIPGLGIFATYSGYVIGQFKLAHPKVLNFGDAGELLFGAFGRELFGWAAILGFVFIQAAHLLTFSVMMNVLTGHSACSVIFGLVGTVLSIILSLPRTLKKVSYISVVSSISILGAVFIVMVSVGMDNVGGAYVDTFVTQGSFTPIFVAVLDIMLAYSGNAAFFGFVSELKDPHTYWKALMMLQGTAITIYTVVAAVIYWYVGRNVDSPALGAASPTVRKVAYAVALPTIVVAGVINGHVAAKQLYTRLWTTLKKPNVVTERSRLAYMSWLGIVSACWVVAWLLAEAIPIFNELLGLLSALFMSWFTYGLSPLLWFNLNRGKAWKGWWNRFLAMVNLFMVMLAFGSCIMGLYASGVEINKAASDGFGQAFSCANNDPKASQH